MSLSGANPEPQIQALEPLPGQVNYFLGNNPERWRTGIQTYGQVLYQDVYPGIDLLYYGQQGQLEFDFVVRPGARPESIALHFEGAEEMQLDTNGGLVLQLEGRKVSWPKPVVYQLIQGQKQTIEGEYVLKEHQEVAFRLNAYDPSSPLVIDPVLVYSTYLGGSDLDAAEAIAVDRSGNVYLTGETVSLNFPTRTPYHSSSAGSNDVFVTKLTSDGTGLVYSTYLGGSGDDFGQGIAIDNSGNAYLTGLTDSRNFPLHNEFQSGVGGNGGASDAFVVKLGPGGSTLLYSTYFGGPGFESGNGIAVDSSGNAYITGETSSGAQFPKSGPFQNNAGGGLDAFVAKFDTTSSGNGSLVYSSWLGGADEERGIGIAVDSSGNAYVCGEVFSLDYFTSSFPVVNALQPLYAGGGSDGFVTKVNASGSALVFSTFLGGEYEDSAFALALDGANNIFVTGQTSSDNFPTTFNAYQLLQGDQAIFGTKDAFITKLPSNGANILYSSFLGGELDDSGTAIAVDSNGAVYVAGKTDSEFFPVTSSAEQTTYGEGPSDAFVVKINPTVPGPSALIYGTYLGMDGLDEATGIGVDTNGNFYVCGLTDSTNFLTTSGSYQVNYAGGYSDSFVAKFLSTADLSVSILASANPVLVGSNLTYTLQVNNNWRTTFTSVFLTNFLPSGVQFISMTTNRMTCVNVGGIITCNVGTLTNNASASVTIVVKTTTPTNLADTAVLVSGQPEVNVDNNNPTVITTVRGFADLAIGQIDTPDPVFVSSNLTYTISVTNRGPFPATQLILTNLLPPSADYISATQSLLGQVYFLDTNLLWFEFFEDLPVNGRATIAVVVSPNTPGVIVNQIGISSFEKDLLPANNTASLSTTVNALADLALTARASASTIFASSNLTYTLTITNKGPSPATGVVLTNRLPAGATNVVIRPNSGCSVAGGVVTCNLGTLTAGDGLVLTIEMTASVEGTLSNISTIRSSVADSVLANNSVTNVGTALPLADLALTVTDAPDPVVLGSNIIYTVAVTNRGPSTAANVSLTDILPENGTFVSALLTQGTYTRSNNTLTCSLGSILKGGNPRLTITVTPTSAGLITNFANVISTATDPVPGNNSAINVSRVNSRPTITSLGNQTGNEDTLIGPLSFTIGDLETLPGNLIFNASSTSTGLLSNASFIYGGSGSDRTLTILPLTNQFGTAVVNLSVTDADGASASTSFSLTVNSVNDPPTLNPIANVSLFTNSGPQTVSLTGITEGPANEVQLLTISATSSQPSLIPNPTVTYINPNTTATLVFTRALAATGTVTITVTLQDNGGTANGGENSFSRSFLATINANPVLRITPSSSNAVVLSWPGSATGFRLENMTNGTTLTNWTAVVTTPATVGDQKVVTNTINSVLKLYRLRTP